MLEKRACNISNKTFVQSVHTNILITYVVYFLILFIVESFFDNLVDNRDFEVLEFFDPPSRYVWIVTLFLLQQLFLGTPDLHYFKVHSLDYVVV